MRLTEAPFVPKHSLSGRTVFAKHILATRILCFQRSSFKAPRLEESVKIFASALGRLEGVIANA